MRPSLRKLALCLALVLAFSLLGGPVVFAEDGGDPEEVDLPEAGLLPGSPFYFIKRLFEGLRLGLIRAPEERVLYIAHLLEVRLAEAETLAGKGRVKSLERTMERYQELAERGLAELERAEEGERDLTEALLALEAASRKSQGVLSGVMAQVPEQARYALQTALQAANHGQVTCLQVMEKVSAGEAPGRPEIIDAFLTNLRGNLPGGAGGQGAGSGEDPGDAGQGQGQGSGQGQGQGPGGN